VPAAGVRGRRPPARLPFLNLCPTNNRPRQVGSDDDGYAVRLRLDHYLRYAADPEHSQVGARPRVAGAMRVCACVRACVRGPFARAVVRAPAGRAPGAPPSRPKRAAPPRAAAAPRRARPPGPQDDSPLYIFDGTFADAGRSSAPMARDYEVPPLFAEDLFRLAGERRRPPHRCVCVCVCARARCACCVLVCVCVSVCVSV
jgi:hypothetical protein